MPAIHFRTTVDAAPERVYEALATEEGLAGNWTDQLQVPEETGAVARFGFGPDWAKTLELRVDALEPARRALLHRRRAIAQLAPATVAGPSHELS